MKNRLLLLAFFFTLQVSLFSQFTTDNFGVPAKNDHGAKIIHTTDHFYVVAGQSNNDAALYKYNCNGIVVDSVILDFPVNGSYEIFDDVLELPNGSLLAVGSAWSIDGTLNHSFVLRTSAGLDILDSDTLRIFGQLSNAVDVELLPNGNVVMVGTVPGIWVDFSDIFCVEMNPNTFAVTDSITKVSYGVDQVTGLTILPNGNLMLCGYSVLGNIFDINAQLQNIAWTRVITIQGTKIWDHTRTATFKNGYGRMQDRKGVLNPQSGNIMVGGNTFSGDTLNPMDAYFMVFSPAGSLLTTYTYQTPGSQNVMDMLAYSDPDFAFLAVGDSTGAEVNEENAAFMFLIRLIETNGQITLKQPTTFAAPIRFNSVVAVPYIRFAYTGVQFTAPYAANNQEGFVGIPKIGVHLTQNDNLLQAITNPPGSYSYVWYSNNQQVASTSTASYTADIPGTYTVQVVDNQGCKGESGNNAIVTGPTDNVEIFRLNQDTICTHLPLSSIIYAINDAATYSWVFSNGATSNQKTPNVSFDTPGNYTATLSVTTSADQFLISEVKVISRDPYFSLTDPIPDLYVLVKNNQGQEVYRSTVHYNVSSFELPYEIPTALLVKNEFYIMEIWDYDALDNDDFLGEVFLTNAAVPGIYTTGEASIQINPVNADAGYTYSRTIHVVAPYIVNNNGILEAKIDRSGTFSYTWYKNNVQVAFGVENTYTPPSGDGCYTVKITGGNICDDISAPYCFTVGTGEITADVWKGIILMPQPVSAGQDLTVVLGENGPSLSGVELYNSLGQLIYAKQGLFSSIIVLPTADLQLSAGVYVLRFMDNNGNTGAKNIAVIR